MCRFWAILRRKKKVKTMENALLLKFSEESRRQTAVWNRIIKLIKEINFAKYNQKEIRVIIDTIVATTWQKDLKEMEKNEWKKKL